MVKTTKWMGVAALAFTLGCTPVAAEMSQLPSVGGLVDLTAAAESTVNSVVYIKVITGGQTQTVTVQDPFDDIFGEFFGFGGRGRGQQRQVQTPKRESAGSGVIISQDGYIVTNNHVVRDANEITVKLNDNREFTGRIIGLDETTDLALIKVDAKNLPAIKIGNSDDLKLGQWVLAVGNPFNLTSTVTAGIVSAKARSLGANGIESFIQTDAAINAGNSGGALVNERGELVGINAMLYSQTGSYSGYGFAIPTTIMNKVVADLKEFGTVQRALLGVRGTDVTNYIDSEKAKGNEVDLGTVTGVYVDKVEEGSAADEAELQKGDVVIKVNGKVVNKMAEMQEALTQYRPGDKVSVTYIRDKKERTKNVTLRNSQGDTKVMTEVDIDDFGVQLTPVTQKERGTYDISYGLVVSNIKRGKLQDAGITKGVIIMDVNEKKMTSVEDWENIVKETNKSKERVLWIRALTPSGRRASFVVELSDEAEKK